MSRSNLQNTSIVKFDRRRIRLIRRRKFFDCTFFFFFLPPFNQISSLFRDLNVAVRGIKWRINLLEGVALSRA